MGGSQPIHGPKNAEKGIDFKHFLWWIKSMDPTPTQNQNVTKTLYIVALFGPSIWHEVGKSYIFRTPERQKTGWDWNKDPQSGHIVTRL